jgi:hypothetical protein
MHTEGGRFGSRGGGSWLRRGRALEKGANASLQCRHPAPKPPPSSPATQASEPERDPQFRRLTRPPGAIHFGPAMPSLWCGWCLLVLWYLRPCCARRPRPSAHTSSSVVCVDLMVLDAHAARINRQRLPLLLLALELSPAFRHQGIHFGRHVAASPQTPVFFLQHRALLRRFIRRALGPRVRHPGRGSPRRRRRVSRRHHAVFQGAAPAYDGGARLLGLHSQGRLHRSPSTSAPLQPPSTTCRFSSGSQPRLQALDASNQLLNPQFVDSSDDSEATAGVDFFSLR